jgi:anti-sigma factor RsiW
MNISTEVIRDLLPAYVAGEASAATRAVVESALAQDTALRAEAAMLGSVPSMDAAPPADLGLATLLRTQRLLRRRAVVAGFSLFFSTFSLALFDRSWGRAGAIGQTACLVIAAIGWALFFRNAARMHAAGLDAPRTPHPVAAWHFATTVYAVAVLLNVQEWTGRDMGLWTLPCLAIFWIPVYWIGRRLHQLRDTSARQVESLLKIARDPGA